MCADAPTKNRRGPACGCSSEICYCLSVGLDRSSVCSSTVQGQNAGTVAERQRAVDAAVSNRTARRNGSVNGVLSLSKATSER